MTTVKNAGFIGFIGEKLIFGARGANKHLERGSLLGGFFHMGG